MTGRTLITVGLVASMACAQRNSSLAPPTDGVVARYDGGVVTTEDVDSWILGLPPRLREVPGDETEAWLEELIQEIVISRVIAQDAKTSDLMSRSGFRHGLREVELNATISKCIEAMHPGLTEVSDDELATAYRDLASRFDLPERRFVYHLFLRFPVDGDRAHVLERAAEFRTQVLSGMSFGKLASQYSDSESRHRQGALEWVVPGQLAGPLEQVVFGLEEGVPSDPVEASDGVHLFFVEKALPARRRGLDEVHDLVVGAVISERRRSVFEHIARENRASSAVWAMDRETLLDALAEGDPDAVVLRSNGGAVTLDEFNHGLTVSRARFEHAAPRQGGPNDLGPWQYLQSLVETERVAQWCRSEGLVSQEHVAAIVSTWSESAAATAARNQRMLDWVLRDEVRLRDFYSAHETEFSTPPRWHLRCMLVPIDSGGSAQMARLERMAETNTSLEQVQSVMGGKVHDLGARTFAELERVDPKLPPRAARLEPGEVMPPFRLGEALGICALEDRIDPQHRSFDQVATEVASTFVQQNTAEVYEELKAEILDEIDFEVFPEHFRLIQEAGAAQGEVTVRDLEELLDEL